VYPAEKVILRSNSWLTFQYDILHRGKLATIMTLSFTWIGNDGCDYCPRVKQSELWQFATRPTSTETHVP